MMKEFNLTDMKVLQTKKWLVWFVDLWCLTPLPTIFLLYRYDQFYCWRKPVLIYHVTVILFMDENNPHSIGR